MNIRLILQRLIGRIKMNIDTIFLTLVAIGIPLGFYLLVEGRSPYRGIPAAILIITSMGILIVLMWKTIRVEREAKQERQSALKIMNDIHKELVKINEKSDKDSVKNGDKNKL